MSMPPPAINTDEFDPFALLGVTIDSTPEDAKSAFRTLALLAHPDKGGRAEEMKFLLESYRFVIQQLNLVNRKNTVEDLENEFAEFCKAQKEADLDIHDRELMELIMGEEGARRVEAQEEFHKKFNSKFGDKLHHVGDADADADADAIDYDTNNLLIDEAYKLQHVRSGYGSSMLTSQYAVAPPQDVPLELPKYKDTIDAIEGSLPLLPLPVLTHGEHSLSLLPLTGSAGTSANASSSALIQSNRWQLQMGRFFGNARPGIHHYEYGEAFAPLEPIAHAESYIAGNIEDRMRAMKIARSKIP